MSARDLLKRSVASLLFRSVRQGPFAGMRLLPLMPGSVFLPVALGTYEREVMPALAALTRSRRVTVLNVGAANGYYAVGLLVAGMAERVVAYESDGGLRDVMERLALRNGVEDRLEVRGTCGRAELRDGVARPDVGLVLMDIEGGELELLDPELAPRLSRVDLLVEVHPWIRSDLHETLIGRFLPTHEIELIEARVPAIEELPAAWLRALARSSRQIERRILGERSPPTMWLALKSREFDGSESS